MPGIDPTTNDPAAASAAGVLAGGDAAIPQPAPADRSAAVDAGGPLAFDTTAAADTRTLTPPAAAAAPPPTMQDLRGGLEPGPNKRGGHWARAIISGALAGLAAGAEAEEREPRSERVGAPALAGLAAGVRGEQAERERTEDRATAQAAAKAKEQRESQAAADESQLRQAQTAYYTTQNASAGFELGRRKQEATDEAVKTFNTFQQAVAAQPDNTDLGVFPDMNAVVAYRKEHPELVQQIAGNHDSGQILAVPNLVQGEDGTWTYQGLRAAIVHPSMMERSAAEYFGGADKIPPISYFIPGKMGANGKPEPGTWGSFQPAPGTPVKDVLPWILKGNADAAKDSLTMAHEAAATTGEVLSNQIKERELAAGPGLEAVDEIGRPLPALDADPEKSNKMRETRRTAFDKDYVKDANQLEQSYKQMQSILERARAGQMTGADSVVGLFNAVGISSAPLKGRGFRINQNIVGEHVGARNIFQGAAAQLSKLTPNGSGELVTPQQLQSYQTILSQARHDLYVSMAQEADRQSLAKDFLPRATAQGQPVDLSTAKIYLDAYGGNVGLARQALGRFGWTIPQAPAAAPTQAVQ